MRKGSRPLSAQMPRPLRPGKGGPPPEPSPATGDPNTLVSGVPSRVTTPARADGTSSTCRTAAPLSINSFGGARPSPRGHRNFKRTTTWLVYEFGPHPATPEGRGGLDLVGPDHCPAVSGCLRGHLEVVERDRQRILGTAPPGRAPWEARSGSSLSFRATRRARARGALRRERSSAASWAARGGPGSCARRARR